MSEGVFWKATDESHPARDAARASITAVARGDKEGWLELFADEAVVEDPVGPSAFDPSGDGHRGHEGISEFWDSAIAQAQRIEFHIDDSFACGAEVANTGRIVTSLPDGSAMTAEGVFSYRVDDAGKILAIRAFWEFERAMATLRPAG